MTDNFLHPIDLTSDIFEPDQSTANTKRSFFAGTLKKKIGPMEVDRNKKSIQNGDLARPLDYGAHRESPQSPISLKNYDEEKGSFIMTPTDTDDVSKLNSLEVEARQILEQLGITTEMLRVAIKNGPRSDVTGAYRIIINRLQKQAWFARRQAELAALEQLQAKPVKRERGSCIIL